ncbi:glycosyltransferase [Microbacterium sp. RD1]|uniref:glycosyltransferase n=1 Tax=Microbacterium sp. RD1 TaxID=3457313 RepID=UPI003FA52665
MTATLRVVLDQLVAPTQPDIAEASGELTRALIAAAPKGADVAAIVPRGGDVALDGLADVVRLALGRRELAASWQLGVVAGVGKGMIHSPTLLAPLVRHDRVHETHQIVVTLWDLRAWDAHPSMPRSDVLWHRAMLKRAEKHADAVVVPAHAMAERLTEIAPKLAGRIRVVAGAPPEGFREPTDAVGRRRSLGLPSTYVVLSASPTDGSLADGMAALRGMPQQVVVMDVPEGEESAVRDVAAAGGVAEERVRVLGPMEPADRAAVWGAAALLLAASPAASWPWRVVEALALGVPVVAVDAAVHREVLADAALLTEPSGLSAAAARAIGDGAERLRVLAADRGKTFSWRDAGERVWQLHAEL